MESEGNATVDLAEKGMCEPFFIDIAIRATWEDAVQISLNKAFVRGKSTLIGDDQLDRSTNFIDGFLREEPFDGTSTTRFVAVYRTDDRHFWCPFAQRFDTHVNS